MKEYVESQVSFLVTEPSPVITFVLLSFSTFFGGMLAQFEGFVTTIPLLIMFLAWVMNLATGGVLIGRNWYFGKDDYPILIGMITFSLIKLGIWAGLMLISFVVKKNILLLGLPALAIPAVQVSLCLMELMIILVEVGSAFKNIGNFTGIKAFRRVGAGVDKLRDNMVDKALDKAEELSNGNFNKE